MIYLIFMFNILGSRILLRTWRAVNFLPPKIHIQKYTEIPTITSLRKLKWFLFASDWLSVGCSFYFILFFDIIFLLPKPILLTDIWATFWWCLDSFWILDIKKSRLNLKQHLTQSKGPSRIFRTLELNKETHLGRFAERALGNSGFPWEKSSPFTAKKRNTYFILHLCT